MVKKMTSELKIVKIDNFSEKQKADLRKSDDNLLYVIPDEDKDTTRLQKVLSSLDRVYTRVRRFLRTAKWWVLHRTFYRFDKLSIKSLEPNYYDKDSIMLHACFQILVDFIEKEKPDEWLDIKPGKKNPFGKAYREMVDLYIWWKCIYPAKVREHELRYQYQYDCMRVWTQEERFEDTVQKQLVRLIGLRSFLWT